MKRRIMVKCPFCSSALIYKNWFYWVLNTPFHWFRKRKIKCPNCGQTAYVKGIRIF